MLVFVPERGQAAVQAALWMFGLLKYLCQVTVRQCAGEQVQARKIGRLDALFKLLPAACKHSLLGFELGLNTKVIGGRSLRVEVAEQGPCSRLRGQIGEIDRRGRFPHPPLHMVERYNLHLSYTRRESLSPW